MIKESTTERGFALGEFKDYNEQTCFIQDSSLATDDCIYLGADGGPRMHLTQQQAEELVVLLQRFVTTRSIRG